MQNRVLLRAGIFILLVVMISSLMGDSYKKIGGNTTKKTYNSNVQTNKIQKNTVNKSKGYVVNNLPKKAKNLKFKDRDYYFNNGIFYIRVGNRYQIVKAPYGMKIKHLPEGVRYIRRNGNDYYYYYNTYYRFEPSLGVYVVINEPDWAEISYYDDRLIMVNGSIMVGQYMGGNRDVIEFLFNDQVKRIDRRDVVSIEFAPSGF